MAGRDHAELGRSLRAVLSGTKGCGSPRRSLTPRASRWPMGDRAAGPRPRGPAAGPSPCSNAPRASVGTWTSQSFFPRMAAALGHDVHASADAAPTPCALLAQALEQAPAIGSRMVSGALPSRVAGSGGELAGGPQEEAQALAERRRWRSPGTHQERGPSGACTAPRLATLRRGRSPR